MARNQPDSKRRRFIGLAVGGVIAVPATGLLDYRDAVGSEKPELDPESEQASQLGYTHDAASTDNAARKPDARCANCTHFHGEAGVQWASCNVFPENKVNADGWCTSWFSSG